VRALLTTLWLFVDAASETVDKANGSGESRGLYTASEGTEGQCAVYAVLSVDQYTLLRTENDYCLSLIQQLYDSYSHVSTDVILKYFI